jgi:hypothetical protein
MAAWSPLPFHVSFLSQGTPGRTDCIPVRQHTPTVQGDRMLLPPCSPSSGSVRVVPQLVLVSPGQRSTFRRPPSARLVPRTGDPDRFGVTTRAVTAPTRAGPEVVPRAGRAALHGRRAVLRAGRPRLGPYSHLFQGALAVEPAHPRAVRVFTAGQ